MTDELILVILFIIMLITIGMTMRSMDTIYAKRKWQGTSAQRMWIDLRDKWRWWFKPFVFVLILLPTVGHFIGVYLPVIIEKIFVRGDF